jgi:hypothetical protein
MNVKGHQNLDFCVLPQEMPHMKVLKSFNDIYDQH